MSLKPMSAPTPQQAWAFCSDWFDDHRKGVDLEAVAKLALEHNPKGQDLHDIIKVCEVIRLV